MRLLRVAGGSLLWILSGVVGLVGALLCLTVILLPLGLPLLGLARRLFRRSLTLFLPRAVRHPGQELGKSARDAADATGLGRLASRRARRKAGRTVRKRAGRTTRRAGKAARRTGRKTRRALRR